MTIILEQLKQSLLDYEDSKIEPESKPRVTKLQDKCPTCHKIAKELFTSEETDSEGNITKYIILECYHSITKLIPRATPYDKFTTYAHRDNGCIHEWNKNECLSCGAYRLFDFQVKGAEFLEKSLQMQKGAALFDETGLGKTVQPLAYLNYHKEALPCLFIVKSGIMFQFYKEIFRWLGPSYLAQIIKTGKDPILPGLKCYIISYDLLRRVGNEKLSNVGIKTIVLDECQQIKNPESSRTQEVRKLVALVDNVIPLSATPWKNRGSEFFTILNMLNPMKFSAYQRFLDRWVDYKWNGTTYKEVGIKDPKQFKEYIKDIALRRERKDVMSELPQINRTLRFTELDDMSESNYQDEVSEFVTWYNSKVIGGEEDDFSTNQHILARLNRMRHITGLAKIPATEAFVHEHIEGTGRKIVVFVHHQDIGKILYSNLTEKYKNDNINHRNESSNASNICIGSNESTEVVKVFKLTGGMSPEARDDVQEKFNATDKCILIASTLAAGEGLNLQTCADSVMHERQWNPANEDQALEGRFIRIGQKSGQVNGTYTTATGTIDEHLAGIIDRKRIQFHELMNTGKLEWNETAMLKEVAESIVQEYNSKVKRMASW